MTEFNVKELIEKLPPELQEKAKACKSADELMKFADDNDIELPQDALEAVSGGDCADWFPDKLPDNI